VEELGAWGNALETADRDSKSGRSRAPAIDGGLGQNLDLNEG
jgi:hypothetical protein